MCMAHELSCHCGSRKASFHMKNSVLPHEVVSNLYCPDCSSKVERDPGRMLDDNGWLIDFDLDVARLMSRQMNLTPDGVTPANLFDEGWCTWNGVEPEDFFKSPKERAALLELAKTDPVQYVAAMRDWGNTRMDRLRQEGWRKAMEPATS